jgi:hypothetical protein
VVLYEGETIAAGGQIAVPIAAPVAAHA